MTEPNIEHINQSLTQANLAMLTSTEFYDDIWDVLDAILEDDNCSEETNFERVRVLLKAGLLTELHVLEYYNSYVEDMDLSYEGCPLVKLLAPLERDGTLYLSGSDSFYEDLCYDLYLDYIKNIVLLGGRVDHDGMLYWVFESRCELEMFNYLLESFQSKPSAINTVAAHILSEEYFKHDGHEKRGRGIFKQLIEKGIDINLPFDEESGMLDYHSFLGAVLIFDPELFEQYLLQQPNKEIVKGLPWRKVIKNGYFREKHMHIIEKLISLKYYVPLDEIVSELEKKELDDYAKALAH
ncbi:hypothetical protein TW84_07165 [Vibrio neptunius]|uniref:hypothetical protein n=1 Tax=Vibrio neptunius TaxID=170651 RepID=UPI0005FA845E|nr:hypothetical protein [Vibrio neptunius]KJY92085.1 hypothetical protein TW84_07165 [Vibrio neptunius]